MAYSKKIVLRYPRRLADRPIVYRLVKDFNLEFNILKAFITQESEGLMVLEIKGERQDYDEGIKYLTESGVKIQSLSHDVTRNEERCTHCGACITICPTGAFELDPVTKYVSFDNEKCVACEQCIKACPPRAMELHF